MNKSLEIRNRIKYWIKTLKLKQKFILKEATKKEKKVAQFSAYTERYNNTMIIGFNPKIITLRNISNHIDRVILHEMGHIMTKQEAGMNPKEKRISVINEYRAEKYMLSILYKYNRKLHSKIIDFMGEFLSDEYSMYCMQYPEHYKAFCKVYNIERMII